MRVVRAATVPLEEAHRAGIVHRDVKPENLFLLEAGGVRVLDFGVAHFGGDAVLTTPGLHVGTPQFMAPEYLMDPEALDGWADIYALGLVLACALGGKAALPRRERHAMLLVQAARKRAEIRKLVPGLPEAVARVIDRATAVNPEERYQTMEELRAALDGLLGAARVAEAREEVGGAAEARRRVLRRQRVWAMIGAGVVALGLVGAGIGIRRDRVPGREVARTAAVVVPKRQEPGPPKVGIAASAGASHQRPTMPIAESIRLQPAEKRTPLRDKTTAMSRGSGGRSCPAKLSPSRSSSRSEPCFSIEELLKASRRMMCRMVS